MKLEELKDAWALLGDIPVDENDCTAEDFSIQINGKDISWPAGTDKLAIWDWFDEKCPNNLAEDLMFTESVQDAGKKVEKKDWFEIEAEAQRQANMDNYGFLEY